MKCTGIHLRLTYCLFFMAPSSRKQWRYTCDQSTTPYDLVPNPTGFDFRYTQRSSANFAPNCAFLQRVNKYWYIYGCHAPCKLFKKLCAMPLHVLQSKLEMILCVEFKRWTNAEEHITTHCCFEKLTCFMLIRWPIIFNLLIFTADAASSIPIYAINCPSKLKFLLLTTLQ